VAQVGASFIASSLSMALAGGKRVAVSAGFTYSHVRAAGAAAPVKQPPPASLVNQPPPAALVNQPQSAALVNQPPLRHRLSGPASHTDTTDTTSTPSHAARRPMILPKPGDGYGCDIHTEIR